MPDMPISEALPLLEDQAQQIANRIRVLKIQNPVSFVDNIEYQQLADEHAEIVGTIKKLKQLLNS